MIDETDLLRSMPAEDAGIEVSNLWRAVADAAKEHVRVLLENGKADDAVAAAKTAECAIWQAAGEEDVYTFSRLVKGASDDQ